MSFLSRLRTATNPESPDAAQGADAAMDTVEGLTDQEVVRAHELREALDRDPNDTSAFTELAELVRRNASAIAKADPLTADQDEAGPARNADLAVWALAEELAGSPRAWFPLLELARLSLDTDAEGAMRRFDAAAERETTGRALQQATRTLRTSGRPDKALSLGLAHWRPSEQGAEAGRELVLAALDAGRPLDAKRLLADLDEAGAQNPGARTAADELRGQVGAALEGQQHT